MPFIAMDIDQSSSVDINIPVSHHHSDVINDWNWWPGGAEGTTPTEAPQYNNLFRNQKVVIYVYEQRGYCM